MWRVLVLTVVTGCTCKPKTVPSVVIERPPHQSTRWLQHVVSEKPDDLYGVPAWSKVFALAFERKVSLSVPPCVVSDAGCSALGPLEVFSAPFVAQEQLLGGDQPQAFIGQQVTFLEESDRLRRLERAIDDAMKIDATTAPVAAVLFQNDLLERIDAIDTAIRSEADADWRVLSGLRKKLWALVEHLALSADTVRGLPSNLARVAGAFPELAGLERKGDWVEVVGSHTEHGMPGTPWRHSSHHAIGHGYRQVFRVFVHAPREVVERSFETRLPLDPGTRFVITGGPMAFTRERRWVAVPFITLVETRVAAPEGFIPRGLDDLNVDVFEGTRAKLVRELETSGGLERLSRGALIPQGATCSPNMSVRVPLATTCSMCHGIRGASVTGAMSHGEQRFSVAESDVQAEAAVAREAPSRLPLQ